jgi:hypothetical protein
MSEPTTEAGRRLLTDAEYEADGDWIVACVNEALPDRIRAIEAEAWDYEGRKWDALSADYDPKAEASADLVARLRAQVEAWESPSGLMGDYYILKSAVLAAIEEAEHDSH